MKGDTAPMDYATALRMLRACRGYRQDEAARRVGMNATSLCKFEGGHETPCLAMLVRIAAAYNVRPESIKRIAMDPAGALGLR